MQTVNAQTFVLNQSLMSISGDLWIEDAQGNHTYMVDGTLFSFRRRHRLLDGSGNVLYEIVQALANLQPTFVIKRDGQEVGTVQKQLLKSILGDMFTVGLRDGPDLEVRGDWIDREFRVTRVDDGVTEIFASRKLISIRDSYGIQVTAGFDVPLALAIVIALEQIEQEERSRSSGSLHH